MNPVVLKIAKKFNISAEDAASLVDAGYDSPVEIRNADADDLPELSAGAAEKIAARKPKAKV